MPSSVGSALLLAAIALALAGLGMVGVAVICTVAVAFECFLFYNAGLEQ